MGALLDFIIMAANVEGSYVEVKDNEGRALLNWSDHCWYTMKVGVQGNAAAISRDSNFV